MLKKSIVLATTAAVLCLSSAALAQNYEWAISPNTLLLAPKSETSKKSKHVPVCFGMAYGDNGNLYPTLCIAKEDPDHPGSYICPNATACAMDESPEITHVPMSKVQ